MPYFSSLRTIPWEPNFEWVDTIEEAADKINQPHEDYPKRVDNTVIQIERVVSYCSEYSEDTFLNERPPILSLLLKMIHYGIFHDTSFAGEFRTHDVTVGLHHPPDAEQLDKLMNQLELLYEEQEIDIDMLKEWYNDFETIHPFEDGNGRTGGVIIAAYSHHLDEQGRWLAPSQ